MESVESIMIKKENKLKNESHLESLDNADNFLSFFVSNNIFLSEDLKNEKNLLKSFYHHISLNESYKEIFKDFVNNNNIFIINKDLIDFFIKIFNFYDINEITNKNIYSYLTKELRNVNWSEFEISLYELGRGNRDLYTFFQTLFKKITEKQLTTEKDQYLVSIRNYHMKNFKIEINNFSNLFLHRFNKINSILRKREQLSTPISILRALKKQKKEDVTIIGMITNIRETKKGYILELEDTTAIMNIYISKSSEVCNIVKELVVDEVIGVKGVISSIGTRKFVFVSNIYFPDIPNKEQIRFDGESYAVFTSDIHIGSKFFLEKNFRKFIQWLNGEVGNEKQRSISRKIKYLFLVGDLVDGIGIYKDQDQELDILDVRKQYDFLAEILKEIRQDIKILAIPGNHDAVRIAEPQPLLDEEIAEKLYRISNLTLLTNPATVILEELRDDIRRRINILLYHGYSFNSYLDKSFLKEKNVIDNLDILMKFLLKKRHLAPSHASTQYIPDPTEDPLVIDEVPDIFASGHIHKVCVGNYKHVTLLNCSSWQSRTPYQIKYNIHPQPSRAVIINLKTRATKILRFE